METAGWKRQGGTYYIYIIYKKKPGKKKNKNGKGVSRETMEILELRKSLKLSRKEFCELYEIPYITVTQWERGERTPPAYLIKLIKKNIELRTKDKQLSLTDIEFLEDFKKKVKKAHDSFYYNFIEKIENLEEEDFDIDGIINIFINEFDYNINYELRDL